MISENDDVWASVEDTSEYDRIMSLKEWDHMNRNFGNIGYREGIIEGKDVTIQEGFNNGYVEGVNIGMEFGRLRGLLNTLLEFYNSLINENNNDDELKLPNQTSFNKLKSLEDELANLTADKVFTRDYFKFNQQENLKKQNNACKNDCSCLLDTNTEKEKDNCCNKNIVNESNNEEIQKFNLEKTIEPNENLAEKLLIEYKEKVYQLLDELGFDMNST
ncbi:unnamed protein product [Rhizophagus irregularis]|uniref:Protein YAE1 n=1 Tax=Rhizophagus irregularis TaxID=588596 RepID=A0A2I1GPF1_9GLOM|nr:hypothetical protein RhiirA4_404483 [Rhizophagus irregularis]CAB4410149.1 unnamed protein product [Rhizophagus irregularis]